MDGVTLPLALAAGVVAFLSPCFLPIVPVFCASLTDGGRGGRLGRTAVVANTVAFIAGFTVVFVALWASIGLVGHLLGDHRDVLRIGGGALLIVLGLHVAGLIRIPFLQRRLGATMPSGPRDDPEALPSPRRSALMGLAFGAGWTPCIGPVLGGVLGLATASETVGQGSLLMVAFSLGLGVPLLLAALGTNAVATRTSWFLRHQGALQLVNGVVLLIIGFLMISDQFGRLAGLVPALGL